MEPRFDSEVARSEFGRLVDELDGLLDALTTAGLAAMVEQLPPQTSSGWPQLGVWARDSLEVQVRSFRSGVVPKVLPEPDAAMVVGAARVEDLATLLSGYRRAQIGLWSSWFELVSGSVTDRAASEELLRYGSGHLFRYADWVSRIVTEEYEAEVKRGVLSGEQRHFEAIRGLLNGEPGAGAELDINLDRYHLGLVAWGTDADQAARELAHRLERPLLLSLQMLSSWWGWISGGHPLTAAELDLLRNLEAPSDVRFAFGLEGYGEAGFRSSHHQALRAYRVGSRTGAPLLHYEDVAIEALATEAEADARSFVAHELRGIDDASETSARLRETLDAYFETGLNGVSAAAKLGVHHQTVTNRLRAIEKRLGHSIPARRLELEVALRVRASLRQ